MNRIFNHINLLIVCSNIIGLGTYIYARIIQDQQYAFLLIIFIISISSIQKYVKLIKAHFCIIALLSVTAVFIKHQKVDLFILSLTFALSTNLGYMLINKANQQYKNRIYESLINLAFSLSVFFSLFCRYLGMPLISMKIIVLITTLPNFFLALPQTTTNSELFDGEQNRKSVQQIKSNIYNNIPNKLVYYMNPIFCESWIYAMGYSIGIYLNFFEIIQTILQAKYVKYAIVALFILIQNLTEQRFVKIPALFFRSLLIFQFENSKNRYQTLFVFIYLLLKNFLSINSMNIFLIVGYVVIAALVWREDYSVVEIQQRDEAISKHTLSHMKQPLLSYQKQGDNAQGQFGFTSLFEDKDEDSSKIHMIDLNTLKSL